MVVMLAQIDESRREMKELRQRRAARFAPKPRPSRGFAMARNRSR
jgi:hypothetical protein